MKLLNLILASFLFASCTQAEISIDESVCMLSAQQKSQLSLSKNTITDYLELLTTCGVFQSNYSLYRNTDPNHPLDMEWIFSDGDNVASSTVDIKNGFIELSEEGSGRFLQQIVLFRDNHGNATIGYYQESAEAVYFSIVEWQKLSFYRLDNSGSNLMDVTQEVLPIISPSDFGVSEALYSRLLQVEELHSLLNNQSKISFELPHFGTDLKANLIPGKGNFNQYRSMKDQDEMTHDETRALDEYVSSIKTDTIELKWDKGQSKFILP